MYNYNIGDKFYNNYEQEVIDSCDRQGYKIIEIEPEVFGGKILKVFTIVEKEKTLEQLKIMKLEELSSAFNFYVEKGYVFNNYYFNINEKARNDLVTKLNCCNILNSCNYTWRDNNNISVDFANKEGLENFYATICLSAEKAKLKKFTYKDLIANCSTAEEINALIITFEEE